MRIHGGRAYTELWIEGIDEMQGCEANIGQALNDIENIDSWAASAALTGWTKHKVRIDGVERPIYHKSAGKKNTPSTCTLFFIQDTDQAYIIAVAKHVGPTSYDTVWTRPSFAGFPNHIDVAAKPIVIQQR